MTYEVANSMRYYDDQQMLLSINDGVFKKMLCIISCTHVFVISHSFGYCKEIKWRVRTLWWHFVVANLIIFAVLVVWLQNVALSSEDIGDSILKPYENYNDTYNSLKETLYVLPGIAYGRIEICCTLGETRLIFIDLKNWKIQTRRAHMEQRTRGIC